MIYEVTCGNNMITGNVNVRNQRVTCRQVIQDPPLSPQNKSRLIGQAKRAMLKMRRIGPIINHLNPFSFDWVFHWNDGTRTHR
jgi:hypothetical protein